MQRYSIQLSPKSIPRPLQQGNDDGIYETCVASTSRFYSESSAMISNQSIMSSNSPEICSFHSPSTQSTKDTSLFQVSKMPLRCDMQGEEGTFSQNQARSNDILSRIWNPCSGGCSIGEQLDCIDFPVSYRDLVYRWIALDRPNLENMSIPLGMQISNTKQQPNLLYSPVTQSLLPTLDLQQICEAQEKAIIESITSYFNNGSLTKLNSFIHFASHLDVYSAVNAELVCLEDGLSKDSKNISRFYDEIWWNTLQAFELDRSVCTARTPHNCFRYFLWGEVYTWPLEDIIDKFQIYKNRSSIIKPILLKQFKKDISGLLNSFSSPCLHTGSPIEQEDGERFVPSPSLSTHMSTLDLSGFVAGEDVNSFATPDMLKEFTSSWQNDISSEGNYNTPSAHTNSTPARSPFYSKTEDENSITRQINDEDKIPYSKTSESIMPKQSDTFSQDTYSVSSFDFLTNLHETTLDASLFESSFLATTSNNWKKARPLSQSALESKTHAEIVNANLTVSTPVTPLTSSSSLESLNRGQKRQMSNDFDQGRKANDSMAGLYENLCNVTQLTTQENDTKEAQQIFHLINTRRDSSSSIGSSFGNENALEKIEKYKKLLQQAATQLGTAARILREQSGKVPSFREVPEDQPFMVSTSVNSSPVASNHSLFTTKRARFTQGGRPQLPFRPRSQTTS